MLTQICYFAKGRVPRQQSTAEKYTNSNQRDKRDIHEFGDVKPRRLEAEDGHARCHGKYQSYHDPNQVNGTLFFRD